MWSWKEYGYEIQYKIFGMLETKTGLKLKSYGNFGSPTFAERLTFPQVLTSMKNEKYLFHPQLCLKSDSEEKVVTIDVEEWQQNEDWTRSPVNFPVTFNDEIEAIWIFKV